MDPGERADFLRNADRWREMSADQRERWRRLVDAVPPLPPLPPGAGELKLPPLPPRDNRPATGGPPTLAVTPQR
jgi:hypothetical protein